MDGKVPVFLSFPNVGRAQFRRWPSSSDLPSSRIMARCLGHCLLVDLPVLTATHLHRSSSPVLCGGAPQIKRRLILVRLNKAHLPHKRSLLGSSCSTDLVLAVGHRAEL
jgi:hypothetical protein